MFSLDREKLLLIKNRINYYREGNEVDTLTGALGLDEHADKFADAICKDVLPTVNDMFANKDQEINMAIIMVTYIDTMLKHSNSDEELFAFLTTGWSSLMDYVKDRTARETVRRMIGGMLDTEE